MSWFSRTTLVWAVLCFFSSRRRHTRLQGDWSSDVCSSDLILTNFLAHKTRERMVYGVSEDLTDLEAVRFWKNKLKEVKPVEPLYVENGPVKQNVMVGDDVDLTKFPWPRWHQRDG